MLQAAPDKLKALLDQTLTYRGISCRVIEILADEPALVLRDQEHRRILQANQYGDAGEHGPRIFTVALFDTRGDGFNPDLPELATLDLLSG
ncbi:MAG: hypothetical protein H6974_06010 [Gammaproteobacteria bacterium]|nr:hypothetical protein [Gammaproteobacteria bacterium]